MALPPRLIDSEWGLKENKRKAKYYKLTAAGCKQLKIETRRWGQPNGRCSAPCSVLRSASSERDFSMALLWRSPPLC